ncbi:MAG: L-threonylcarbamoyladenylate synthase [Phycisphaerae bacterium]|nr:L-threonylcarbamoyladenylate synthase [Phycisphaerae bacterium]
MPKIVKADATAIKKAASIIRDGGVVAFPTETVYGLGCDTFNERAALEVYRIKRRHSSNPLIAHVLDIAMAKRVAIGWDVRCQRLAEAFWPGPLTFVLPRRAEVAPSSIGGRSTVAVRSPSHPVARQLLEVLGTPISAPSANRSGRISPTRAEHVAEELAEEPDLMILDGGASHVGLESTVLDLSRARPLVLRPGSITAEMLKPIIGDIADPLFAGQTNSPGTATRHYAPRARAELVDAAQFARRLASCPDPVAVLAFSAESVPAPHVAIVMPTDPAAYAAKLYDSLRHADSLERSLILVERPPEKSGIWAAIHDRLRRATT